MSCIARAHYSMISVFATSMVVQLCLALILIYYLVETNCQHNISTPYLSFLEKNLSNNSYADISLLGAKTDGADSVQCRSELYDCCNVQPLIGDWYRPDGTRLPFPEPPGVYFARNIESVDIRQSTNNTNSPTGIYHCKIVFNASNPSLRVSLYIGLYASDGGDISVSDDVGLTVVSDLNGESPQFNLTCTSTGGPATTVTWTRDSTIITEGNVTVLDDPETAHYTHTLTVTGRLPGLYNCTVENNKPSINSTTFTVQGSSPPTELGYTIGEDSTSMILTWTPPTPLGYTTGYRISFTSEGNNDVTDVSGGSTNNYTLTGLRRGEEYNISIITLSQHFHSQKVFWNVSSSSNTVVEENGNGTTANDTEPKGDEGDKGSEIENGNILRNGVLGPILAGSSLFILLLTSFVSTTILLIFLRRRYQYRHKETLGTIEIVEKTESI